MFHSYETQFSISRLVWEKPPERPTLKRTFGGKSDLDKEWITGAPGRTLYKPPEAEPDTQNESIDPGDPVASEVDFEKAFPDLAELYGDLTDTETEEFINQIGAMDKDTLKYYQPIVELLKEHVIMVGVTRNWNRESIKTVYKAKIKQFTYECKHPIVQQYGNDKLKGAASGIYDTFLEPFIPDAAIKYIKDALAQVRQLSGDNPYLAKRILIAQETKTKTGRVVDKIRSRMLLKLIPKATKVKNTELSAAELDKQTKEAPYGYKIDRDFEAIIESRLIPEFIDYIIARAIIWDGDTNYIETEFEKKVEELYKNCKTPKIKEEAEDEGGTTTIPDSNERLARGDLMRLSNTYGIPITIWDGKKYDWEDVKEYMSHIEGGLSMIERKFPERLKRAGTAGRGIILGVDEMFDNEGVTKDRKYIEIDWNEKAGEIAKTIEDGLNKLGIK